MLIKSKKTLFQKIKKLFLICYFLKPFVVMSEVLYRASRTMNGFIFLFFYFLINTPSYAGVSARNTTSVIIVKSGSNFVVENAISGYKGTIKKDSGANISGNTITFDDGVLDEAGNKVKFSGTYNPGISNKIVLSGGKKFKGEGGLINQSIEVSGTGNRLEGNFLLNNDIELQDANSELYCDVRSRINGDIKLNGGILNLDGDLFLADSKRIVGPGRVAVNGHKLTFGSVPLTWFEPLFFDSASDVELSANVHLESVWSFSGTNILNLNSNILYMDSRVGGIIVQRGSSLLLKTGILRKVANEKLFCMDNISTITFQDVRLILDSDYTFSLGHFDVLNELKITGTHKFVYQSTRQSSISVYSELILDRKITFSYDPIGGNNKELISFEDETSILYLDNATLHTTTTGLKLTKGTMIVDGVCNLSSEIYNNKGEGITFGDDRGVSDFHCEILGGSVLNVSNGDFIYRNVEDSSWNMSNQNSILDINAGAYLKLYYPLSVGRGRAFLSESASYFKAPGACLIGSVSIYKD